jgi:predicted ATPase
MLVAISGSQGAGKTTVLQALEELGHNIVSRKTSRSILTDWGVTLEQVNGSRDLTLRFQDEIIARKFKDESHAIHSDELWFTERTYTDLFTYALVSLGKDNINSEWLNDYYDACKEYQHSYKKVFYIEGGIFDVEHDGVRGSNQHYSTMVDLVMSKYTWLMAPNEKAMYRVVMADINDRVEFILDRTYNHK